MIGAIEKLPERTLVRNGAPVLAWGEVTSHSHRIEDPKTAIFHTRGQESYFEVVAESARLVHEEHRPIVLPRGFYRFWHQREYTPGTIRRVVD